MSGIKFKDIFNSIKSLFKDLFTSNNEIFKNYSDLLHAKEKTERDRKLDLIALLITVIIVSVLIFIFWKVPFLHNIIFP